MTEAWYAAFGLLALLTVANSVVLIAMVRQVGVLHQRMPPTGPGSVGPDSGTTFKRLELSPVPGGTMDGWATTAVTILAYITPDCGLCERIPGFLEAYTKAASPVERGLVSFVLATDAPEQEAQRFLEQQDIRVPFVRHPRLKDHYDLTGVGAPYLLALVDGRDGQGDEQLLLAGGIVNSLEQLEDLVEISLHRYSAHTADTRKVDAGEPYDAASHGDGSRVGDRLTVMGR
jgi:hypothetical protein